MTLPIEVMAGAIRGGTSILFAGVGESFAESAGVVNLGVEGSMLCGALASYAVTAETGNVWAGVVGVFFSSSATDAALQSPALKQKFLLQGAEPTASSPAQLEELMRIDYARWAKLVATAHLTVD